MNEYTKTNVRNDFKHARYLMNAIDSMITGNDLHGEDYEESSEFGQAINELVASVGTALAYRIERSPSGY